MKKRYLSVPLLVLLFAAIAYTVIERKGHDFTADQCSECHAVTPVSGKRDTLVMTAPVSVLCFRCHAEMDAAVSHPVELVPRAVAVPPDLPLSREGKLTCSTCHDIHSKHEAAFGTSSAFLRRPVAGSSFCSACHGREEGHAVMIGKAHMKQDPGQTGSTVDDISRGCLSCHDGSLGHNQTVRAGSWEHGVPLSRFDPRGSHPIGMDYLRASTRRRGGLRPVAALNPVIKLVNGKVGCGSCHDPYSKNPKKLVMANTGSRLCLACHDK